MLMYYSISKGLQTPESCHVLQESIAVTQNYVSSANLQQVLNFLKAGSTELVSGCPFEQRGRLHDAFVCALQKQRPQVRQCLFCVSC